jgi:hypothetical protein
LFKDGVSSELIVSKDLRNLKFQRCTASSKNLDSDLDAIARSQNHRRLVMEAYSKKEAWDEYGIVADVIVSDYNYELITPALSTGSLSLKDSPVQTFMNSLPLIFCIN